jgi:hypothetical protein
MGVRVGPGRGARSARTPNAASEGELADFETEVLAGFVLARASAGLADSTIRNDTNHHDLAIRYAKKPPTTAPEIIIAAIVLWLRTDLRGRP